LPSNFRAKAFFAFARRFLLGNFRAKAILVSFCFCSAENLPSNFRAKANRWSVFAFALPKNCLAVFGQLFWRPVYEQKTILLFGSKYAFCLAILISFPLRAVFEKLLHPDSEQFWIIALIREAKMARTAYQKAVLLFA